ncbi:MAG: hypothetical protein GX562_02960 [Coriobacteriaceae bacterium]|nr:hypothetical protein [Coriobacteriaceae bacterium]
MGDFIAIVIVLLAVAIIVFRIVRRKKGDQMPGCCAGCTGCDLEKYGIRTDCEGCKTESELKCEMKNETSSDKTSSRDEY